MAKALARSIKNKRDYQDAKSLANKMREQRGPETDEERRLQALLLEIEKFDSEDAVDDDADIADDLDGVPSRRWSDDESE